MLSSDTMKEESLNNYKDLISNWLPFSLVYSLIKPRKINYACDLRTPNMEARKCLLHKQQSNNVCEQIHCYNNKYNKY